MKSFTTLYLRFATPLFVILLISKRILWLLKPRYVTVICNIDSEFRGAP